MMPDAAVAKESPLKVLNVVDAVENAVMRLATAFANDVVPTNWRREIFVGDAGPVN